MTELLILLYLGDIASQLSPFLGVIGWLTIAVNAVVVIATHLNLGTGIPRACKVMFCVGATFAFLAVLVPSKHFFYIAAGGTAAVRALDSEIGKKVTRLIELKLDEVLPGEEK